MNDFVASNGARVSLDYKGRVVTAFWTANEVDTQALREFFQAEADEQLSRWRWPDNPNFVVYAPRPGLLAQDGADLFVVNELWGSALAYADAEFASYDEEDGAFAAAGRAYFDAHPESKPEWHDAEVGEVWVMGPLDVAYTVVGDTERWFTRGDVFGRAERRELTDPGFTAGRRIWKPKS